MDILIVGGGYAGLACALRLAQRAKAQRTPARIKLIHPWPVLVERIRLHQAAAGQRLKQRRIAPLLRRAGAELVTGWVEAIDLGARTLRVGPDVLRWDRLVLAVGSQAGSLDVPGAAEHAWALEPGSAPQLPARLQALPEGGRVLVVGGGLTGIEAASEIAEAFPRLRVEIASRGALAADFSAAGRAHVQATLARLRVAVREGVDVRSVEPGRLPAADGALAFDACVWAAGFRLPALPREAGLRVNAAGQVLVDPMLRSLSHPAVYAVGDIAAPLVPPGQPLPMGCKSALPTGAHAGENLARELRGAPLQAFDYALPFFCVSLGRQDGLIQWADAAGRLDGRILSGTRAAWFKEMICKTTWWALAWEAWGQPAVVWKRTGLAIRELPREAPLSAARPPEGARPLRLRRGEASNEVRSLGEVTK